MVVVICKLQTYVFLQILSHTHIVSLFMQNEELADSDITVSCYPFHCLLCGT